MTDKVQTKVYLPKELKELLDQDKKSNSALVERAIHRELGSGDRVRLERRLDELDEDISRTKARRNERERELHELKEERATVKAQLETLDDEYQAEKETWFRKVRMVDRDPDHELVQEAAEALEMSPEAVLMEAYADDSGNSPWGASS